MGKYTIETDGTTADSIQGYLGFPIKICGKCTWVKTDMELTPYTEPDLDAIRKEAYQQGYDNAKHSIIDNLEESIAEAYRCGYETAKHECEHCQKVRADAEQELAEKAYQRGLNDAWEAARKICLEEDDGGIPASAINDIFNVRNYRYAVKDYSASECIEKIRAYEHGKEEMINIDKNKVEALANDIGIHKLYALVKEIRGE